MVVTRTTVIAIALALAACSETHELDMSDEDLAAIYAQPFAAEGCRAGDSQHWLPTPGGLPGTGAWNVRWTCVSDCRGTNTPAMAATDTLEIGGDGMMRFRRAGQLVEQMPYTTIGNCRIAQPSASPCRSAIRVCGSSRCSGCAQITYAAWGQLDVNRVTAYEAVFTRP